MPVSEYMALCLTHPQHGYYLQRHPFGTRGDFTTAPEISQMFGEMIGLWTAAVWQLMGSPENVRLVELGPGRGTLMRDALRATQVVPGFRSALVVHMVEISAALEQAQRQLLEGIDVPIHWHRTFAQVPPGPGIVIANEFVDALPVQQLVKQVDGWHERMVGVDALGNLAFGVAPEALAHFERIVPPTLREAPFGAIYEWRSDVFALELGRRVRTDGAALVIDYGHTESALGDTLQAVEKHGFADPLSEPGTIDITAHVDFRAFGQAAETMGARIHGPLPQGEFLRRLGIAERAAALLAQATRPQAIEIETALGRLTRENTGSMGGLFKAIALTDPKLGVLPGFET